MMKIINTYKQLLSSQPEPDSAVVSLPLSGLLFRPWTMLADSFRGLLGLVLIYGALLSIVALLGGFAYVCRFNALFAIDFYCQGAIPLYLLNLVLQLFLITCFGMSWCALLKTEPFSFFGVFRHWRSILANMLRLFAVLLSVFIPVFSFMMLQARVPDPNWKVEVTFFAIVSLGFFTPFIAMRLLALVGRGFFLGQAVSVEQIWRRNKGNMLKILFSLSFILLVAVAFFNSIYFNLQELSAGQISVLGIPLEIIHNIFMLIFFTLFLNHCLVQYDYLYDGETNDR